MNSLNNSSAFDLLALGGINPALDNSMDIFRETAKVLDEAHVAMGRKPIYKMSSVSTTNIKVNLNASSTTRDSKV